MCPARRDDELMALFPELDRAANPEASDAVRHTARPILRRYEAAMLA